jgi:catechol 2,3-dioxygenase-like lactoylglutathione lyase family enzyme
MSPVGAPVLHRRLHRASDDSGKTRTVIGRLEKTVVDCPDPRALAEFYASVLGMRINEDDDGWVVIGVEPGQRQVAFQRAATWVPPEWPDPLRPQQLHLDIRVDDDIDEAERAVVSLGARRVDDQPEAGFRVFLDPVGHPFCLLYPRSGA